MKKLTFVTVLIAGIILLAAFPSRAGDERGNGGDAIVCPDKPTQLYDYYEWTQIRKKQLLAFSSQNPFEIVREVLKRLERRNPSHAKIFRQEFETMTIADNFDPKVVEFVDGNLVDVPDTGSGWIPHGCEIKQAAVSEEPLFPGEVIYRVSHPIYQSMTPFDRAGLILHEIMYRYTQRLPVSHGNSRATRYFNSLIVSPDFDFLQHTELLILLNELKFVAGDSLQGFPIDLNTLKFHPTGELIYANTRESFNLTIGGVGYRIEEMDNPVLEFHKSGLLAKASIRPEPWGLQSLDISNSRVNGFVRSFAFDISWFPSGEIEFMEVLFPSGIQNDSSLQSTSGTYLIHDEITSLRFWPTGHIKRLETAHNQTHGWVLCGGIQREFYNRVVKLEFNEDGTPTHETCDRVSPTN